MGIFGYELKKVNKGATTMSLSGNVPKEFFQLLGGTSSFRAYNTPSQLTEAYAKCPILSTVISRKTSCFINGKIEVVRKSNGNFATGAEADKIKKLFYNPNNLQTDREFRSQVNTYLHIYGYAVILKVNPFAMNSVSGMWCLPPNCLEINFDEKPYFLTTKNNRIKSIYFVANGKRTEIKKENCFIVTYLNTTAQDNGLLPYSPLSGLEYPIQNIIKAYESLGVIIENRGAEGILSNTSSDQVGVTPLPMGEKDEILRRFKGKYGLMKDQSRIIVTEAALKWQSTAMNVKDLMLNEEVINRSIEICDKLGYPTVLLGISQTSTYNNVESGEESLYNSVIIPEAESYISQFNDHVIPEDSPFEVVINFKDVATLQKDKKDLADARMALNKALEIEWLNDLITLNQWREALEYDTTPDGDIYYSEKTNTNGEETETNESGDSGDNQSEEETNSGTNN